MLHLALRTTAPLLALATVCLAGPSFSQSAPTPQPQAEIIRGLCNPEGCDEFSVVSVQPIQTTLEGSLKRTVLRTYRSTASGRETGQDEQGYVYCSPTRPAIIAEQRERSVAFFLAPFATADSRETVRKYTNFIATYFAICHGPAAGRVAARDLRGVARSYGYQVEAAASRVADLKSPYDVISPEMRPAAPVPARPPTPPRPIETMDELEYDTLKPPGLIPED